MRAGFNPDHAERLTDTQLELMRQLTLPGEKICWVGCEPRRRYFIHRMLRIGLLIAWTTSVSLFAAFMILMNPTFLRNSLTHMGPILALVALAMLSSYLLLREIFRPGKSSFDLYAITTQRALVISPGRDEKAWSYGPEAARAAQIKRRKDGSGDIIFERIAQWSTDFEGRLTHQTRIVGFFGLRSVDEIHCKLQQIGPPH